jgi:hypothetical protein
VGKKPGPYEAVEVKHDGELAQTKAAVLYAVPGVEDDVWIPRKTIIQEEEGRVVIPRWLAEKRGLPHSPRPDLWTTRWGAR